MSVRVGINGFGRIGRSVLRILADRPDIEVAVINDLFDNDHLAYLFQYDTVMGVFEGEVSTDQDSMTVRGRRIHMTAEKDPSRIPWERHGVDVVIESTGKLTRRAELEKHLAARSEEGRPDRSGEGRDRRDDRARRERRRPLAPPPPRLQRFLHDQLPRARSPASSTRPSASKKPS